MLPLISIIISVYNSDKFIVETLKSILDQEYQNIELIIIDDGSTDNTVPILNSYEMNKKIKIFYLPHSGNIGKNLNYGISNSKGEFICICGADDVWNKDKLTVQYQFLKDYMFVCSNAEIINECGVSKNELYIKNVNANKILSINELLLFNSIIASSVILASKLLKNEIQFDENKGHRAEDYYLWLKLAEKIQIYYLNKPLLKYRIHENNLSFKTADDVIELSEKVISIKKNYLGPDLSTNDYALDGILNEYSKLIKITFKNKKYDQMSIFINEAKGYIVNKGSLKNFKYSILLFYAKLIMKIRK